MVLEHRIEHPSMWGTLESIAPTLGCVPQTLHEWVRKHELDTGMRDRMISAARQPCPALPLASPRSRVRFVFIRPRSVLGKAALKDVAQQSFLLIQAAEAQ